MREYVMWRKFNSEHPFPFELIDLHGAMLCSVVLNLVRSADSPPHDMRKFLLLDRPKVEEDDGADGGMSEASKFAVAIGR